MTEFRKKLLTQLGITLGIIAVIAGLVMYVFNDFEKIGKSIEEETNALAVRRQAINSLSSLRADADRAGIIVNQLRNALPKREALFLFSEEMNRLARERELTPSFTFGNEVPSGSDKSPGKAEFIMNISGEYQSILSFLNAFDSSRYFTNISSLEFRSQGANTTAYQAIIAGGVFFSE